LSLYRPREAKAFCADERGAVKDISHYVAHAVNRPKELAPEIEFVAAESQGMVLIDFQGHIVEAAARSLILLSMALERKFSPGMPPLMVGDTMPASVPQLLALPQRAMLGVTAAAPRTAIDGPWGRFLLSAWCVICVISELRQNFRWAEKMQLEKFCRFCLQ
jgi:hypothetical protein